MFFKRFNKVSRISLIILLAAGAFLFGVYFQKVESLGQDSTTSEPIFAAREVVLPEAGFTLPVKWGDLGPRLIKLGVIDPVKFKNTVNLNSDEESILEQGADTPVVINADNAQFVVDLLWAIGLAQKSDIYQEGPMGKEYKKDVANFASTGGWNLARGNAMQYLGKFELFNLSADQQKRVSEIAKNVYRPCCGNSTWFPDCNHGMAALAAIEMMVAQNLSDKEIYENILKLNSFWFPSSYLNIATYFERKGTQWQDIDAKLVLGKDYSSGAGAANIAKEVGPQPGGGGGGSCGT